MGITAGQRAAAQRVYLTAITGGAVASGPATRGSEVAPTVARVGGVGRRGSRLHIVTA